MMFLAKYIPVHKDVTLPDNNPFDYYRTVYADSVNEAGKLAARYTRKGFLLASVTQQRGKD